MSVTDVFIQDIIHTGLTILAFIFLGMVVSETVVPGIISGVKWIQIKRQESLLSCIDDEDDSNFGDASFQQQSDSNSCNR